MGFALSFTRLYPELYPALLSFTKLCPELYPACVTQLSPELYPELHPRALPTRLTHERLGVLAAVLANIELRSGDVGEPPILGGKGGGKRWWGGCRSPLTGRGVGARWRGGVGAG